MARAREHTSRRTQPSRAALGKRLADASAATKKAIGPDEPVGLSAASLPPPPTALGWLAAGVLGSLGAGAQLLSAYYAPVFASRLRSNDLQFLALLLMLLVTYLCGAWFGGLVRTWTGRGSHRTMAIVGGLAVLLTSTITAGLIDVGADGLQGDDGAAFWVLIPLGLFFIGAMPAWWLGLAMGLHGWLKRAAVAGVVPAAIGLLLLGILAEIPYWSLGQGYRPTLRIAFTVLLVGGALSGLLNLALLRVAANKLED